MLTFTTFNLKKTSLVTVLQKTSFIQKRFMQRASDEVGKKVEWPTQRWFSSLVNRGSSSRSGSSATLSQMGATRRQQDVAEYRRASTAIGIQVRHASSQAEVNKFEVENKVEILQVDEPTKKGIQRKYS